MVAADEVNATSSMATSVRDEQKVMASDETVKEAIKEAQTESSDTKIDKSNKKTTEVESEDHSKTSSTKRDISLLDMAGQVTVTNAAEFTEAWNTPAVTKITVTDDIDLKYDTELRTQETGTAAPTISNAEKAVDDYMADALKPRANNIEITSNNKTINLSSSVFTVRRASGTTNTRIVTRYYGLPVSTGVAPDININVSRQDRSVIGNQAKKAFLAPLLRKKHRNDIFFLDQHRHCAAKAARRVHIGLIYRDI